MKKSEALRILGLHDGASEEDIKKAHRKKVIENHPDRVQDPTEKKKAEEKTKLINEARDVLLSGKWDPEFGSGYSTSYGNPYRTPYQQPGQNRGGQQQGWPFGFDPNQTWTVWGSPSQGGNRQGTYDPFNPFAQQQAPQDAATRAKEQADSDLKMAVTMFVIKVVVCGVLAATGSYLGGALIWAVLTFMLLAADRFGGCIWLFLFPVFFLFNDMVAAVTIAQGNIVATVAVLAVFAVALGIDIRDLNKAYRRYRVTSGKKTWQEKRAEQRRDKKDAKAKAKAAKQAAKSASKNAGK